MQTIICKNCENQYKGNFCPTCGQSADVHKINAKYFLHDIPHSVLHIDKGFLYSLLHLLKNPGTTLKEYLDGKRVKHFKPFAFVIILSTICTLLVKFLDKIINLKYTKTHPGFTLDSSLQNYFAKYPSLVIFALIPFLSIITWLFFKKEKYNYWEHFLVNTYLAAYLNVFFLVIKIYSCIKYLTTNNNNVNYMLFIIFFMSYYGYAFDKLMPYHKRTFVFVSKMILFITLIVMLYMTAFSFVGMMQPWWKG